MNIITTEQQSKRRLKKRKIIKNGITTETQRVQRKNKKERVLTTNYANYTN